MLTSHCRLCFSGCLLLCFAVARAWSRECGRRPFCLGSCRQSFFTQIGQIQSLSYREKRRTLADLSSVSGLA